MKIAFLLPGLSDVPIGGYAVVYEYANRLVRRGHDVAVLFPSYMGASSAARLLVHRPVRALLRPAARPAAVTWFELDPRVRLDTTARLAPDDVADRDVLVATAWNTAEEVLRLVRPDQHGVYLIQSHETWAGPTDRVEATWRAPLTRVVIARWLVELAAQLDALPVEHVPNAVDSDLFSIRRPISGRRRHVVMLWHPDRVKGSDVGLEAIERIQASSAVDVTLFSAYGPPSRLPPGVTFRTGLRRPEVADLLNDASVFMSPSRLEGWALPPAEAMACGCALVTTDIGGVRDYAADGDTALVVPTEDAGALADAVLRLLDDDHLRRAVAERGSRTISECFDWERSTAQLEAVLGRRTAATGALPR